MLASDQPWLHVLSVSWPRPVDVRDGRWIGPPAWDAPAMPFLPSWRFHVFDGIECDALDWGDFFRADLQVNGRPTAAQMRGFHVVFRLRVQQTGRLVFFDTDGCIIRRNGEIVHEDRDRHPIRQHELEVRLGDRLEVAHWQSEGRWIWGARCERTRYSIDELLQGVEPYRQRIEEALTRPDGPALKVFTNGVEPVRCVLSIYSLVLNGYRPAGIQVFGEHQWDAWSTRVLRKLLPFADIVSLGRVEQTLDALNPALMPLTRRIWGAMKVSIGLFFPPYEYCFLDDDVFVLDRMDDALRLWDDHDLVYAPDHLTAFRYGRIRYPKRPDRPEPLPRNLSSGIYLLRNNGDLRAQSERVINTPVDNHPSWYWEQGFFAWEFAYGSTTPLPDQRYFVPRFDGLPGGFYGYDWRANPCDFACVHFGATGWKPGDEEAGMLFHDILGRHRAAGASGVSNRALPDAAASLAST